MKPRQNLLYEGLATFVAETLPELDRIQEDRRKKLEKLSRLVAGHVSAGSTARLVFICTHNSRRSHMSQIWAQTAAHYFGIANLESYSGGTEATAFDPRAVAAIGRAGFLVEKSSEDTNPVYRVRYADGTGPMECTSKLYDQPPNPAHDFCAVMTCSRADHSCPVVIGATDRIAIPYEDPKGFDGTDEESTKYDECCRQIGREMLYLFSQV